MRFVEYITVSNDVKRGGSRIAWPLYVTMGR